MLYQLLQVEEKLQICTLQFNKGPNHGFINSAFKVPCLRLLGYKEWDPWKQAEAVPAQDTRLSSSATDVKVCVGGDTCKTARLARCAALCMSAGLLYTPHDHECTMTSPTSKCLRHALRSAAGTSKDGTDLSYELSYMWALENPQPDLACRISRADRGRPWF